MWIVSLVATYLGVFGALTMLGGFVGFIKAKSVVSLVAGGIAGVLLIVSAFYCQRIGVSPTVGLVLGLIVSLALAGRFVMAFRKSRNWMPAGMIAVLSVGGVLATIIGLVQIQR